ncbi:MAG: hypothetical protein KAR35_05720 [Candidatus Heimdallarchaeota archaeon]|nr:hypothetical protein [Candidatus Heimdallarchaeota archaeon]MCK5048857.1 hypothetical protein [Candidatus Heimdallarchaeota archaeon]
MAKFEQMKPITAILIGAGQRGGDLGLLEAFVAYIREDDKSKVTTAKESLESHLMAFAADISRVEGRRVNMKEVRGKARKQS